MHNPMDLSGTTHLVTGASSGLGRAIAIELSKLGAGVVLVGRNADRLQETLAQMEGEEHWVESVDLTDVEAIGAWMKKVVSRAGKLSGLVHCAGVQFAAPIRITKIERVDALMRINFTAAFALAKAFRGPRIRSKDGGSIVLLSSVMAHVGQPGVSAYGASKGALVALSKSLALEFARDGVRVNCVSPGLVETEMSARLEGQLTGEQYDAIVTMHPLGPGRAIDVANAVSFLLAPTSRWITGTTLVVDGGYTAS